MKRTRRDNSETSTSKHDKERLMASMRRQRAARLAPQEDQPQHGPADHFENIAKVEVVVDTHDSNVEVDVEPIEPS